MIHPELLDDDRVRALFDSGEWEVLEGMLTDRLEATGDDALSRYRRANLWLHQGKYDVAPREFDLVRSQSLFPLRCQNNKAAALAHSSDFLSALGELSELADAYAPACVNLAMAFAALPAVSEEAARIVAPYLNTHGADTRPDRIRDELKSRAAAALDSALSSDHRDAPDVDTAGVSERTGANGWEDTRDHPLDAAWVLWLGELPTGGGFPGGAETENVRESHRLLTEARLHLGDSEFDIARGVLAQALRLNPQLRHQVIAVEKEASIGLLRSLLISVRELWWTNPAEASLKLSRVVDTARRLNSESAGRRVLAEELVGLSEALTRDAPHLDLTRLEQWTALADALVDLVVRSTGEGVDDDSGLAEALEEAAAAVQRAWETRVRHGLLARNHAEVFDALRSLSIRPPVRLGNDAWIADLRTVAYDDVCTYARALAGNGQHAEALALLRSTEDVVRRSGAGGDAEHRNIVTLATQISQEGSAQLDTSDIEALLDSGEYVAALDAAHEMLQVTPFSSRLAELRARSVGHEMLRIKKTLSNQRYREALRCADELFRRVGGDAEVRDLYLRVLDGWADHLTAWAGVLCEQGRGQKALKALRQVLHRKPHHEAARSLFDKLRADQAAVRDQMERDYEERLLAFVSVRDQADVLTAAAPLKELIATSATREETVKALAWFGSALRRQLEARMVRSITPEPTESLEGWTGALNTAIELTRLVSSDTAALEPGIDDLRDLRGRWIAWTLGVEATIASKEENEVLQAVQQLNELFACVHPLAETERLLTECPWLPRRVPSLCGRLADWLQDRLDSGIVQAEQRPATLAVIRQLRGQARLDSVNDTEAASREFTAAGEERRGEWDTPATQVPVLRRWLQRLLILLGLGGEQ